MKVRDIMVEEEFDSIFFENIDSIPNRMGCQCRKFSTDAMVDLVYDRGIGRYFLCQERLIILNHVFVEVMTKDDDQLDRNGC